MKQELLERQLEFLFMRENKDRFQCGIKNLLKLTAVVAAGFSLAAAVYKYGNFADVNASEKVATNTTIYGGIPLVTLWYYLNSKFKIMN